MFYSSLSNFIILFVPQITLYSPFTPMSSLAHETTPDDSLMDLSLPNEDAYMFLRYTDKPDRDVEYFWCLFKANIVNMARDYKLGREFLELPPSARTLPRPTVAKQVEAISHQLNQWQAEGAYGKIQEQIVGSFEDLVWAFISHQGSRSSTELLLTFARRWDSWCHPEYTVASSFLVGMLRIYLTSFRCTKGERDSICAILSTIDGDADVDAGALGMLFDLGISTGKSSIVEAVTGMRDMTNHIIEVYGIKLSPRTRGPKLIRVLQARGKRDS